jgi:hypothetical protein
MDQSVIQRQGLLKKALTVNAVFSVFSGVVILLANRWLVRFLGLSDQVSLTILGVSLIIFATILWLNARRPRIRIVDAWVAVIMDAAWVVSSYTLIFLVPLRVGGKWVIALVAEVVLAFAILQWIGIRRVRSSERYA